MLQNSAVNKCLTILSNPRCNFICNWTETQQRHFHAMVIELVLGSDINSHFDLLTRFQMRVAATVTNSRANEHGFGALTAPRYMQQQDRVTRLIVLQLAMTCAMHGTALLPLRSHQRWTEMLQQEHFAQGDEEEELGLQVTPLMDRRKQGICSPLNQVHTVVAIPRGTP